MDLILILPVLISLIGTLLILPPWIRKSKKIGLIWEDMNKYGHPKNVAGSGGLIVILSFLLGVLTYVAFRTFIFKTGEFNLQIFAILMTVLFASFIGFVDDLFGWVHGGLSIRIRLFLVLISGIPLMVINAGHSLINFPLIGTINIGFMYPLFLIPLGILGATTSYNILAGFNGLEAGQGLIILSFLSYIAYLTGSAWLAVLGLCMVASLFFFYISNKFPAKVFPGDVLTYGLGAMVACMSIIGNFEKIAIFIFIPYIIEAILKSRGGLKKQSFGIPNPDGSLNEPYEKIYGLEHLCIRILKKIKGKAYEIEVVYLIFCIQIVLCLLSLVLFKNYLF